MNERYGMNPNGQRGAYRQPGSNGPRYRANGPGPGGQYGSGPEPAPGAAQVGPPPTGVVAGPLLAEFQPPYRRRSAGVVVVQMYANGGHSVLWPSRPRQDHNRPMLRQPYAVYEVAVGEHVRDFPMRLPAAGDAEFFDAEASVHWQVEDPVRVVEAQVRDVGPLLSNELQNRLRYVSRRFRLTEAQLADEAVQTELSSGGAELGARLGLWTKVYVRIDLSERVVERVREGTGLDHELELEERKHRIDVRQQQHRAELVRARQRELQAALADGDDAKIAHFMALEPGHELDIARLFARESQAYKADRLAFLTKMIETGVLERHQVNELTSEALKALKQQSAQVLGETVGAELPGGPENRRGLEAGSARGRRRPFWETDDDGDPASEAARGEGPAPEEGERAVREGAWDEEPSVYEPSSVESAEERDRRTRDADDFAGRRRGGRAGGRASDRFDDWGD